MKTEVKRFHTRLTSDQLAAKVIHLRQTGPALSYWGESNTGVSVLCVRMEVVSAPPSVLRVAHLNN